MERLKTNYKGKMREEESASGITVEEISELDALICEIIERERMAEEERESNANLKKNDADKKIAEEIRKVAMERYGETRKRSEEEDNTDKKVKRRKSGGDAVEFLREKAQMEKELRKEEMAIKKKEQEQEAARQNMMQNMMQKMMQNMMQLQQQQQQQAATMMALVGRLLQDNK